MTRFRKILAAIEPWYQFGEKQTDRLDAHDPHFSDESWGAVRFFTIQWFGIHFSVEIGRTPPKRRADEVARRRDHLASARMEA